MEFSIGEKMIDVKELTVAEVRDWFNSLATTDPELVGDYLFEECTLYDLQIMTNANDAMLDSMTQSQIRELIEKCKMRNPDFFAFRAKLEVKVKSNEARKTA